MKKLRLKNFLKHCYSAKMDFRVIEEQPNGHSKILCEHQKRNDLLKEESILNRIVSGWHGDELITPYVNNPQFNVYVYPEGVTTRHELTVFSIKKYDKFITKGIITENGKDVHCEAYFQNNIGAGYIWIIRQKAGSKKKELQYYMPDDPKVLALINLIKKGNHTERT